MVKKILIVFIVIGLCTVMLFACGKEKDKQTNEPTETTSTTEQNATINKPTNTQIVKYETREIDGVTMKFGLTTKSSVENIINGKPSSGDTVTFGNYQYLYNMVFEDSVMATYQKIDGWSVCAVNKTISNTSDIKDELFGIEIKSMNYCFYGCDKLKTANKLPNNLLYANYAFAYCSQLDEIKELPKTIQSAQYMFAFCTSLEEAPRLPEGLLYANNMFEKCTSLSGIINIPKSLETYKDLLNGTINEITIKGTHKNMKDILLSYSNVINGNER